MPRRIVAEHDDLDVLQTHAAVFRPTAVIADAHPHDAVHCVEDREPEVSGFEIRFLQMLERSPRLMLMMPGRNLAAFAGNLAFPVDDDCRGSGVRPFSSSVPRTRD